MTLSLTCRADGETVIVLVEMVRQTRACKKLGCDPLLLATKTVI
jgi:hypothetical protein